MGYGVFFDLLSNVTKVDSVCTDYLYCLTGYEAIQARGPNGCPGQSHHLECNEALPDWRRQAPGLARDLLEGGAERPVGRMMVRPSGDLGYGGRKPKRWAEW
jgi:hypothetical protein